VVEQREGFLLPLRGYLRLSIMQFSIVITVPTESSGWAGTIQLSTIQMNAPTEGDAIARMEDIVKHMPEGTTFFMVAL